MNVNQDRAAQRLVPAGAAGGGWYRVVGGPGGPGVSSRLLSPVCA